LDFVQRKFYTFTNVTFFESVLYFTPTTSIPQPMPSFVDLKKEIVPNPLKVYTRCFKDMVSISHSVDPEFTITDPNPPHSASLPIDLILFTVEKNTSPSSDLDLPIAH